MSTTTSVGRASVTLHMPAYCRPSGFFLISLWMIFSHHGRKSIRDTSIRSPTFRSWPRFAVIVTCAMLSASLSSYALNDHRVKCQADVEAVLSIGVAVEVRAGPAARPFDESATAVRAVTVLQHVLSQRSDETLAALAADVDISTARDFEFSRATYRTVCGLRLVVDCRKPRADLHAST